MESWHQAPTGSACSGLFDLESIAPGGYRLFAWDHLDEFEYYDPAFLQRFELRGMPLTVRDDSRQVRDVEILTVP